MQTQILSLANGQAYTSAHLKGQKPYDAIYGELTMLHYAAVFLIIAIIAAVLGFGGIAGASAGIAKILFLVFLVLFVLSLVMGKKASL